MNGDDPGGVTRHGAQWSGVADVIQLHVSIIRPSQQFARVWTEAEGSDGHGVTLQSVEQLLAGEIKHVDDAIDCSSGQILAIRTSSETQGELALTKHVIN